MIWHHANLMARLLKDGLIEKRQSEEDKREVRVRLSEKGKRLIDEAMPVQAKVENDLVKELDSKEKMT